MGGFAGSGKIKYLLIAFLLSIVLIGTVAVTGSIQGSQAAPGSEDWAGTLLLAAGEQHGAVAGNGDTYADSWQTLSHAAGGSGDTYAAPGGLPEHHCRAGWPGEH